VQLPRPWSTVESHSEKSALERELSRELKTEHPLFGVPVAVIARRHDRDDVLFEIQDGSERIAEVHLTYAHEREEPPWPMTSLFATLAAWVESGSEGT
jgi:hypothetical protein